jgi:hypothetical protein
MKDRVKRYIPLYEKGDYDTACEIAKNYETAIKNGKWTLQVLRAGVPHAVSKWKHGVFINTF